MAEDYKGKIDFAIITIREDENRAVLKRFPKEAIHRGKHRSYVISRVPLAEGRYYLVAIVRSMEQGEGHGQDVARDAIEDLDPQWIFLVGIAGGVPAAEFTLGDVVAVMRLTDFSVKAVLEGRSPQYAVGGGPMHRKVQDLLTLLLAMDEELGDWNSENSIGMAKPKVTIAAKNLYGSDAWKSKVKESLIRHFGRSVLSRPPLVTTGAVASSDTLMKDTQTLQQWLEAARQLIAVEMELGGIYIAARRPEKEYPILAIRGISDIIGFKRHADWTEYACHSAAAFVHALILTGWFTTRRTYDSNSITEKEVIANPL
jgi:nucleoside phosphorylase